MRTAAAMLFLVLVLIVLDACRPAKKVLRRPRESHRLSVIAPRTSHPPTRAR